MKRYSALLCAGLVAAVSLLVLPASAAAESVLIYENEESVRLGRFSFGSALPAGVLVVGGPAAHPLLGFPDGRLTRSQAVRADLELGVVLLRSSAPVGGNGLEEIHRGHLGRLRSLGPAEAGAAPAAPAVVTSTSAALSEPFEFRINDAVVTGDTLRLPARFKKAPFRLAVRRNAEGSSWSMAVKLSSDPKLGFWKQERRSGLNDVPERTLVYTEQALLKPFKPGSVIDVAAEAVYIEQPEYVWTVRAEAKDVQFEKRFRVRFE